MTEIEQLKGKLQEKINELNVCLENQQFLRASLKSSNATLAGVKSQLKGVEAFLKHTNEQICQLKLENQKLNASIDVWMERANSLEFKVQSARDVKD